MKPLSVEMACLLGIQNKIQAVCVVLGRPHPNSCQYPLINYLYLASAESAKDYFIESLEESRVELGQNLTRLSDVITNRVCEKSSAYLKQVSDIPR